MTDLDGKSVSRQGGKRATTNHYRTTCKACRLGIYGNDGVWIRTPQLVGLVHPECAPKEGL